MAAKTQLYALRFALYMALIGFLLHIPLVARLGKDFLGWFSVAYTVGGYVEYMSGAVILHAAMRAFGGAATLQASLTIFALLTAYLPLVSIALWPVQGKFLPFLIGGGTDSTDATTALNLDGGVTGWGLGALILLCRCDCDFHCHVLACLLFV
jgi:hypothetical protein